MARQNIHLPRDFFERVLAQMAQRLETQETTVLILGLFAAFDLSTQASPTSLIGDTLSPERLQVAVQRLQAAQAVPTLLRAPCRPDELALGLPVLLKH